MFMFSAALFTRAKRWMQTKYLLSNGWIRKMWYRHETEHYSSLKRKEILTHATMWMNLEDAVLNKISSVQSLSFVQLFVTPWTAACPASLSIINSQSLLKYISIESVVPSNHLILCHSLLLLPSVLPSIRVFSNESVLCIRWPKYWSFSFSPSSEYSGLISFKDGLVGSPCRPRDSQESFPTPQLKSISSLALSFLYSPTLTSIHDYWKNHSFD